MQNGSILWLDFYIVLAIILNLSLVKLYAIRMCACACYRWNKASINVLEKKIKNKSENCGKENLHTSICSNSACNKIIQNAYTDSFSTFEVRKLKIHSASIETEHSDVRVLPRTLLSFNTTLRCWWPISTGQGRHHDEFSKSHGLLAAQLRA